MREAYEALLTVKAGEYSVEMALRVSQESEAFPPSVYREFALDCAKRVMHYSQAFSMHGMLTFADQLMLEPDPSSSAVHERFRLYANARAAMYAIGALSYALIDDVYGACREACLAAAYAGDTPVSDEWYTRRDAEITEQLKMLSEYGNPFCPGSVFCVKPETGKEINENAGKRKRKN